ncbi:MAG: RDD family protein [Clostridiales bacterium]|nr:RDD family protein [Clostridiales bacterium]
MNTNASMFNRFFAVFLDLLTFLGYAAGIAMAVLSSSEIDADLHLQIFTKDQLIKAGIVVVLAYFVLDVLLTRIFATTPGKLCMNCDVDFHAGNTMVHNIIRSFFKVVFLFSVIPGLISYLYGSANVDNQTIHDKIARTNVTDTTRTPRGLGIFVVFVGIVLLVFFIITYHSALGINPSLGLSDYKIFEF